MADEKRIAEIEARLAAATAGPWVYNDKPMSALAPEHRIIAGNRVIVYRDPATINTAGDFAFMAHAREDIPYLLTALRTARADALREAAQVVREQARGWAYPMCDSLSVSADEIERMAEEAQGNG